MRDPYQVLSVSKSASAAEVKKAYRKLAKELHPDVNPGNKKSEEKFKEVGAAFEILGDEKKRKLYDEFGEDAAKLGFDEAKAAQYRQYRTQAPRGGGREQPGGFHFDFGGGDVNVEDLFGDVFGTRRRGRARGPRAGADVEASLEVSLHDAVLGAERDVHLTSETGEPRRLKVKIPPGVTDGSRIRLAGQGSPGERGGPPGELYLIVGVKPHPLVKRDGDDLTVELPVTVAEAMLGAEVQLPTFEGSVHLRIPPGSQTGKRLRLKARGVPHLGGGGRGDLYARLSVRVPEATSPEAKEAAEALSKLYAGDVRAGLVL